jgi:hypothetical protein
MPVFKDGSWVWRRSAKGSGHGFAEAGVGLVLSLLVATEAQAFTLGRAVEPPPPLYTSGPTQYGATVERTFSDARQLQAFCNFYLGAPPPGAYYQACYIPAMDTVVLPDARAWPSARERAELRRHEWAHARGWRHDLGLRVASQVR